MACESINFTTSMPDALYATVGVCDFITSANTIFNTRASVNYSTSAVSIRTGAAAAGADPAKAFVAVFR